MSLHNQEETQISILKSLTLLQANEEFLVCLYGREIHKFKRTFAWKYNIGSAAAANIRKDLEGSYRSIGLTNQRFIIGKIPDNNPDTVENNPISLLLSDVERIKVKGLIQVHVYVRMKTGEEHHLLFPKYYIGQPNHREYLRQLVEAVKQLHL